MENKLCLGDVGLGERGGKEEDGGIIPLIFLEELGLFVEETSPMVVFVFWKLSRYIYCKCIPIFTMCYIFLFLS